MNLLLVAALAAADPCAGVLDRTDACPSPAQVAVVETADPKTAVVDDPHHDDAEILAPALAVGGTTALVAGGAMFGVSYVYAKSLVDALLAGKLDDAERDRLVLSHRVATGGAIALFVASGLLYGSAAAFAAFDPRSGAFLLPLFPSERE